MAWLLNQALQGSHLKTKAITFKRSFLKWPKVQLKKCYLNALAEMKFWSGKSAFSIQN